MPPIKITINSLRRMKETGEKIACLTSYDSSFAILQDKAMLDVLLVGDSLGMVIQGAENTLKDPVSSEDSTMCPQKTSLRSCLNCLCSQYLPF